jgi:hypothetical protein
LADGVAGVFRIVIRSALASHQVAAVAQHGHEIGLRAAADCWIEITIFITYGLK